jgi:hypothetical protein
MMPTRWFLPLLWAAVGADARTSSFWSRLQYFTPASLFSVTLDLLSSRSECLTVALRTIRDKVWRLVLVGFFVAGPALNLAGAASPVTSESMTPVLPNTLPIFAPAERIQGENCDEDEADPSAPQQILGFYVLRAVGVDRSLHDSARTWLWPRPLPRKTSTPLPFLTAPARRVSPLVC